MLEEFDIIVDILRVSSSAIWWILSSSRFSLSSMWNSSSGSIFMIQLYWWKICISLKEKQNWSIWAKANSLYIYFLLKDWTKIILYFLKIGLRVGKINFYYIIIFCYQQSTLLSQCGKNMIRANVCWFKIEELICQLGI